MQKNKLLIAGVTFVALLGIAMYALKQRERNDDPPPSEADEVALPEIDRDAITALELTRPGDEEGDEAVTVRLEKVGDDWRLMSPVEAEADMSAVDTALDKLGSLELDGIVATRSENHARLEVDEEHGIRIVVHQGDADAITLFVGARRGQNTMIRLDGEDRVFGVAGSIKYAFNKAVKDWRNKRVVDVDPERVQRVRFESENGLFEFARAGEEWTQSQPLGVEAPEPLEPIERFGSSKVQSLVASVARMRAVNFGEDGAVTGLETPTGTVTLFVGPEVEDDAEEGEGEEGEEGEEAEAEPAPVDPSTLEQIVVRIGGTRGEEREFFLQREGDPVVYVISQYLADRIRPTVEGFQEAEPGSEPEQPEMPQGMPGLQGMPGMPGGNPSQMIPPELMQQIQQQLQQQAGMN